MEVGRRRHEVVLIEVWWRSWVHRVERRCSGSVHFLTVAIQDAETQTVLEVQTLPTMGRPCDPTAAMPHRASSTTFLSLPW